MKNTIEQNEVISSAGCASLYNEQNLFNEKLKEGYTEVAFGRGGFVYRGKTHERVARMWAFYHPDGKVLTHEVSKSITLPDPFSVRHSPFEMQHSKEEFEEYIKNKKLIISDRSSLADIINKVA